MRETFFRPSLQPYPAALRKFAWPLWWRGRKCSSWYLHQNVPAAPAHPWVRLREREGWSYMYVSTDGSENHPYHEPFSPWRFTFIFIPCILVYNSDEKELLVYATDSERAGIAQTMWLFDFYQELFNDFLVSGVVAFALDRLRKCICLLPVSFVFYRISPAICHRSTCPAVLFAGFVQFFKHILDACSITTVFFLNLLVLD